jgi:hypothetical protein
MPSAGRLNAPAPRLLLSGVNERGDGAISVMKLVIYRPVRSPSEGKGGAIQQFVGN